MSDNRTIAQSDNRTLRAGAEAQKLKTWFTMVLNPWTGKWTRVGNAYFTEEAARSWVPFVRLAWRGCRTKVASCTLRFRDGVITPETVQVLNKKFNMNPPTDFPAWKVPQFKLRASALLREVTP